MTKVLIVDDNHENLDMIEFLLKGNNYQTATALNGKIALELLRKESFDLIISDILMPVMDGFQLCKECKSDDTLKKIMFIFYTATYIDQKDEEFALSLGAQRFVRKPQDPEKLLNIVNDVIGHARQEPAKFIQKGETEILKLYNERLIHKLEKKNQELELEVEAHKSTVIELISAKEKAEESDRLKTAFLANMSHEIRTPLNTIVGFSKIMAQNDPNALKHEEMAQIIDFNSRVLIKIIDDILDVSILESGSILVNSEIVHLDEIVENILATGSQIKKDLQKEHIELLYKPALGNLTVIADKVRIAQILNNLVSNALKYTETGKVELGYTIDVQNKMRFYVKDSGIGIPQSETEKIFTRFYKASNNTTTLRGLGLGLALSKQLVELMGGEISFDTHENKGTTFYFTLPCLPHASAEPAKPVRQKIDNLNDKHILVAEDDEGNYLLAQTILKRAGAHVIRALNGVEAVDVIKKRNDIDFVLMDIKMPLMDGIEATRIIRETNPELIIIALSAYVFTEQGQNIFSAGFNYFITKPFDADALISVLKKI